MKKTTKILVSALLTLCMLLPMATMVFATTTPNEVANSKYTGSTESATEYYQGLIGSSATQFDVYSADALVALVALINADANGFAGKTVSLKCDLIFNEGNADDWAANPPANLWTPIANFKGTFNGEGHTVSGLYISSDDIYSGFFGCLKDGAQVSNLGVVNSYIKNTKNVNGTSSTTVAYAGSIAGGISGINVKITGCYSDAILSAVHTVGGIVGSVANTVDASTAAIISECAFEGKAHSTSRSAAGIVGTTDGDRANTANDVVVIRDCVNFGAISTNKNNSGNTMGGIIGFIEAGTNNAQTSWYVNVTVERCLNFDEVTTNGTTAVGSGNTNRNALIGQVRNASNIVTKPALTVNNCFIFTDLEQNFFAVTSSLSAVTFKLNNTIVSLATKTDPNACLPSNTTGYVIADSNTVKTTLPEGYTNWTTRTKNAENDYPLPTAVYDNFFKVELKYVQSTDLYDTNKYDVRIIAEVDSFNYNAAGFEVIADGNKKLDVNTKTATEVKVYKTVNSISESYTAVGGRYYVTITITGISGEHTLKVTPYTYGDVADSETKVTGAAKTLTFGADGVCTNVQ